MIRQRSLCPSSATGWYAVLFAALALVWVFFGRVLQTSIRPGVGPGRIGTTGREYVALAIVLGAFASALGFAAIVRRGDRSLLVCVAVVPAALLTVFWLIFGAAEVLFPH